MLPSAAVRTPVPRPIPTGTPDGTAMTAEHPVSRRSAARGVLVGAGALATLGLAGGDASERWAQVPLYSATVALLSPTERLLVRPGTDLVRPDSRIAFKASTTDASAGVPP